MYVFIIFKSVCHMKITTLQNYLKLNLVVVRDISKLDREKVNVQS